MFIVDTNVLIYSANNASPQHPTAKHWLQAALNSGESVGFPWVCLLGFIRLSTSGSVMPQPSAVEQALGVVERWLEPPNAVLAEPGPRHFALFAALLAEAGTGGNLTTDAHIAALALEARATLVSFDRGFARFGVKTLLPGQDAKRTAS
jgi:toxin-antitoxin system PIN domain toxin